MQTTPNLGLKKPDNTDPTDIQDLNDNADKIDQEIVKKVDKTGDGSSLTNKFNVSPTKTNLVSGEKQETSFGKIMKWFADLSNVNNTSDANKPVSTAQQAALNTKVTAAGGDIADTKVSGFTASTAAYPVPAAGETPRVFMGKVKKFFEDMNNLRASMLFIGGIVNNCVTNNASLPLSAAQGKALMDLYTQLYRDLAYRAKIGNVAHTVIDLINTSGIYYITGEAGLLLHMRWDDNYSFQLFNAYGHYGFKTRTKIAGIWGSWINYGYEGPLVWQDWMTFFKKSGIVIVNINAVRNAASNNIDPNKAYLVSTLPVSYRPTSTIEIACKARVADNLSDNGTAIISVHTSGEVYLRTDRRYTSNIEFDGCGSWITNN